MLVLGLDVSTSCTGYCLLRKSQDKIELVNAGAIKLSKLKTFYQKAVAVERFLESLNSSYEISRVAIEVNLQSFRPGMSSAKTLFSLAKFNGVVGFISERITSSEPMMVNATSARSKLGIKIQRNISLNTKEQVLDWVKSQKLLADYSWPTKKMKSGPRKDQTVDDPSCFDIADATVIAMFASI